MLFFWALFFHSSFTWCATVSGHCAVYSASRVCPTSHGTHVADRIYEYYVWLSVASSDRPRAAVAIKMNRYIQWCVKVVVQFERENFSYFFFVALKRSAGIKNCGDWWFGVRWKVLVIMFANWSRKSKHNSKCARHLCR